MEETLGKRIITNRKRLGLTQDKLAERLGVTAQAVSKWENDQSCPDITMLPRLAEIFGITTDALLGIERSVVHEAEVVAESEVPGLHIENNDNHWEVKWDGGRKNGIGLALWVLLAGLLLLASSHYRWGADLWEIAWPSGLLIFGLLGLWPRFSFFRLGCALFGGYYLLDDVIPNTFVLGKEYLLPIFLLLFGLSLLVDALRKNKKPSFKVFHNGVPAHSGQDKQRTSSCTVDGENFVCSTSFGENARVIAMPLLSHGDVSVSFGELAVDLSGCQAISERCTIEASCSFGELCFRVPRRWRVEPSANTAFGDLQISGTPSANPEGTIYMDCSASFGEIEIHYI